MSSPDSAAGALQVSAGVNAVGRARLRLKSKSQKRSPALGRPDRTVIQGLRSIAGWPTASLVRPGGDRPLGRRHARYRRSWKRCTLP